MSTNSDENKLGVGLTGWLIFMVLGNVCGVILYIYNYIEHSLRGGYNEYQALFVPIFIIDVLKIFGLLAIWILRLKWGFYLVIATTAAGLCIIVGFLGILPTTFIIWNLTGILILRLLLIPKWRLFN